MGAQPQPQRHGIVIRWKPRAHGALEMFVDEVGPEESIRSQAGQDVPGSGDGQENHGTGKEAQLAPAAPAPRGGDEQADDHYRKHYADQPARKHRQRRESRGAPIRFARIERARPAAQEEIKNRRELERVDRLGDRDSCEQKKARACRRHEPAVEARPHAKKTPGKRVHQQDQAHHCQGHRETGRECRRAEQTIAVRNKPVMQRRLHQVANTVHVQHDPVAALQHLAGDHGM